MSATVTDVARAAKEALNYNGMTDAEKIRFYEELLIVLSSMFRETSDFNPISLSH